MEIMRLENKIAIITGAAKGIGGTITRTLGREGANMMLPFTAGTVAVVDMDNGRLVVAPEAFEWDENKS